VGLANEGATIRFEPESVRVTGPRRAVARLAAVHPARQAFAARDSGTFLVVLDTADLGVQVRPARVLAIVSPPASTIVAPTGGARADSLPVRPDTAPP
jgi:hypothetical protein